MTAPACAGLAAALRQQADAEPPTPPPYKGLLEFITWLTPEYRPPHHLAAWIALIERAATGEPVRGLCSVPIRHFKSQTTMAGVVWLLTLDPAMRILVLTYSLAKARQMGKRIRDLANAAGVGPTFGNNTIDDWSNASGGGVIIMSAEQSRLGADVHLVFFDDPLDEHASMNALERSAVDATIAHYTARCMRNGKPGAVLGVMSRWHPDDPIGRREEREAVKWEYIHHPAIVDLGGENERAFAPEVWSLDELRKVRAELAEADPVERIWWAQFQGDPKPEGSSLFSPHPMRYDVLPPAYGGVRLAYGADLAFTQGAHSDYFAMVALKVIGTKAYLLESTRVQLVPHMIESTARAFMAKYGPGPIYTYASGPEWGTIRNLAARGLRFVAMKARYNKLVRAERTIKRWNDGQILVPVAGAWVHGFLSRVEMFRGEDKGHDDDEIDALVAASDGSAGSGVAGVKVLGASYGGLSSARPSGAPAR